MRVNYDLVNDKEKLIYLTTTWPLVLLKPIPWIFTLCPPVTGPSRGLMEMTYDGYHTAGEAKLPHAVEAVIPRTAVPRCWTRLPASNRPASGLPSPRR